MYPFNLLATTDLTFEAGIEIILESFAEFYHELSPKHQKGVQLIIIDQGSFTIPIIQKSEKLDIKSLTRVLNHKRVELIDEAYKNAHFYFLPSRVQTKNNILNALSKGIPILSFKGEEQEELIDYTCGMLIEYLSTSQSIGDFVNALDILYHDPEACKILKKGALEKYKELSVEGLITPKLTNYQAV